MNDQEKKNNGTQQPHPARIPFTACAAAVVFIPLPISEAVLNGDYQGIDSVRDYGGKQNIGNDVDEDIFGEQLRVEIELPLSHFRWQEQLQVTRQMDDQEEAKKQAG